LNILAQNKAFCFQNQFSAQKLRNFLSKVVDTFGHFSINFYLGIFAVVKILDGTLFTCDNWLSVYECIFVQFAGLLVC